MNAIEELDTKKELVNLAEEASSFLKEKMKEKLSKNSIWANEEMWSEIAEKIKMKIKEVERDNSFLFFNPAPSTKINDSKIELVSAGNSTMPVKKP